MSDTEHDPEFEAFLKRRSPMHRRLSDFDHAEPSIELDRLVLGRARAAIEAPAQPPVYRATRWAMPVGLAATILIAFTVLLNIDHKNAKSAAPLAATAPVAVGDAQTQRVAKRVAEPAMAMSSPAKPAARASDSSAELDAPTSVAPAELAARASVAPGATSIAESASDPAQANASTATDHAVASTSAARPVQAPPPGAAAAHADAESWLREIANLRAAGKSAEADRELVAFRRAYPAHAGASLARPPTK
jgi:hypothetical protein